MSKESIRTQIDSIDDRILQLLTERAALAKQTSQFKNQEQRSYYDPRREREVLERIQRNNLSQLKNKDLIAIYREIMSACRNLQKPLSVAYLGPEATYSHKASLMQFGQSVEQKPYPTIEAVFKAVERGECDFGVAPYENSTEGIIGRTLDMFVDSSLKIYAEIYLQIRINLLSKCGDFSQIERVYTFKPALDQCVNWIQTHLPRAKLVQVGSTAEAAMKSAEDPASGAVASEEASARYEIPSLEENIQDLRENVTRFLALSQADCHRTGKDKTSIIFTAKNKPGALYEALKGFEEHNVNLSMIYSRPSKKSHWEYYFFTDFQGHRTDPTVEKALERLTESANWIKTLGSYPEAMKSALPDAVSPFE